MPEMPAFLAPAGPQPRRLTRGRARARQRPQKEQPKKSSPQASPETQMRQNIVNSSVLWLGSRARARQKARKRTGKKQGPRSTRASHSKSKTDRTTAHRSAQQFLTVFTALCRARTQHRRHARQRLAPKCAKMSLAYIPPIPSQKQCFFGREGFLEGSLDDADQAPLKHHPGPTPDPDDVSCRAGDAAHHDQVTRA